MVWYVASVKLLVVKCAGNVGAVLLIGAELLNVCCAFNVFLLSLIINYVREPIVRVPDVIPLKSSWNAFVGAAVLICLQLKTKPSSTWTVE